MKRKSKLFLSLLLCLAIAVAMMRLSYDVSAYGKMFAERESAWKIVIDAGHGGADPGKVGTDGTKESDINLAIAKELQALFTMAGAQVYMTREDDGSVYRKSEGFHKQKDMEERARIINAHNADVLISIHQNSYTDTAVSGPQVFFYSGNEKGEMMEKSIQGSIEKRVNPPKKRQVKTGDEYYLLKQDEAAGVIVECGFLSNPKEMELLGTKDYQEKMAWAIYMGTMNYLLLREQVP